MNYKLLILFLASIFLSNNAFNQHIDSPSNTSTSKNIRLLSCNDEAAAKELSGLLTRSFYASDGWVDVYQGGQVYSKNKFYKYQNGVKKTSESLPHNATAPSGLGNKVRLGVTWKYLPNGGTNSIDDILLGTGETVSYNKIVYNSMSVDDQIKLLAENVQGLTLEQAKFIIEFTKSRNAKVVFGGSRVRGNAKITSDWSTSSDLDLGFDGLTSGQRNSLINDFNKKFAGSSQNKIIEHNWIYPNSSPANIQQILSAEEFFMRSGIRSSYEGGKDFGPSGFISISSDGTVILGN